MSFGRTMGYEKLVQNRDADLRKYGIDITVIDDSEWRGWVAAAVRTDEIYMRDVKSFVANVLKKKGPYKIRRLDILDHGNDYEFQIGDDRITHSSLPRYAAELQKLKPAFGPSGFVHLQHCDIGVNKGLLIGLAKLWDVSVYAGTGKEYWLLGYNSGDYVRADPNGAIYLATGRPSEDTYQAYFGMHPGEYEAMGQALPREPTAANRSSSVAYEDPPPLPKRRLRAINRPRR